ncbi:1-acyl-sn-glycerol-3-phosphate acyltransferase [Microbacterium sp. cf332]|uniref:lysophospholipid acyltransferase family protein n=1 Tax=Microbacterium sp. cf332 TaxID=1761804 RepID=UPI000880A82B|nr:lysophospholipid acyltransferase family protein [Microbacterium sp. cf332]SDQ12287.1 1-acyl-sn-glycerol-3-phosphate acyltransferases [Microbacterium sp. cf332]
MPEIRRRASAEKTKPTPFWLAAALVVPAVGLLAKIEIDGAEHLPEEGPYVLAPNHYSEFDPIIVAVATWRLGRAPRFMAKESLFRVPVVGWVLRGLGMIPVSRTTSASAAGQAISQAAELVADGRGVIVYPEGSLTREPDMWPMRGKSGAVRVATAGDIPIIPVATWGVQGIMPRYGRFSVWPLRKRVRVLLGPRVELPVVSGTTPSPTQLIAATDTVMARIAGLLGELRGENPPAARWNPGQHGQKETGRLEP